MRRRRRPDRIERSPVKLFVTSVGMLVGLFALLVAVSYPAVAVGVGAGVSSVPVIRRLRGVLTEANGLCIPGTEICLRPL